MFSRAAVPHYYSPRVHRPRLFVCWLPTMCAYAFTCLQMAPVLARSCSRFLSLLETLLADRGRRSFLLIRAKIQSACACHHPRPHRSSAIFCRTVSHAHIFSKFLLFWIILSLGVLGKVYLIYARPASTLEFISKILFCSNLESTRDISRQALLLAGTC